MDTIKQFLEADAKRTQGEWFWSLRTLRSHIESDDSPENKDILGVDGDRCIYGSEPDCDFIALASTLAPAIRTMLADIEQAREAFKDLLVWHDPHPLENTDNELVQKSRKALSALDKYKGGV